MPLYHKKVGIFILANDIPCIGVIVKVVLDKGGGGSVINVNRLTIIRSRMENNSSIWVALSGASLGSVLLNEGGVEHP